MRHVDCNEPAAKPLSSTLDPPLLPRRRPSISSSSDAKEVRIMGSKGELLRTLVAASSAKTADFECPVLFRSGAPEEIRTPDPQIRSLVLYPAELRALV